MRLLVVEDEVDLALQLQAALQTAGFAVDLADNGVDAEYLGSVEPYAAIVLDIGLPRRDGLSVLASWRRQGMDRPVLLLTARASWQEKVRGIDAGADDYLAKPFQMEELVSRLRALVRRSAGLASAVLVQGTVALDTRARTLAVDGRPVEAAYAGLSATAALTIVDDDATDGVPIGLHIALPPTASGGRPHRKRL